MVVAEVPLWVGHHTASSSSAGGGALLGTGSGAAEQGGAAGGDQQDAEQTQARSTLSLLTGMGGSARCAIYSVDVHPDGTRFATAGGDGKVCLWNTQALGFLGGGNFRSGGRYESSAGESSAMEEDDLQGSSGGDNDDEHGKDAQQDAAESSSSSVDNEVVNDISNLVRRKKTDPKKAPIPITAKNANVKTNEVSSAKIKLVTTKKKTKTDAQKNALKKSDKNQRLLCTLSSHSGSVLSVRFSPSGTFLASAGDDAAVCIYSQSHSKSVLTGNLVGNNAENGEENTEHWRRIKICRGHNLDVVGVAWAPDDSHLVTCSLDSETPIIVWKLDDLVAHHHHHHSTKMICSPFKILGKGVHTSTVKGVTFDPAGSYLASSADDPAICIWRAYDDWGLERRIDSSTGIFRSGKKYASGSNMDNGEAPAAELANLSLFRRISWSPDGTHVCGTNATIRGKNVASMVSREGWAVSGEKATSAAGAANLVGHKQPVVCSRHCPYLMNATKKHGSDEEDGDDEHREPEYSTLLALGDKGGFVTIWSTRKSRPIFKMQLGESRCTVTDMTWGKVRGAIMLVVSLLDGHVVALRFQVPDEVGPVLSEEGTRRVFRLKYGIELDEEGHDMLGNKRRRKLVDDKSGPKLIENALQFTLEEEEQSGRKNVEMVTSRNGGTHTKSRPQENWAGGVAQRQVETISSVTGKKRIRPVLVSVMDGDDSSMVNGTAKGDVSNVMDDRMKTSTNLGGEGEQESTTKDPVKEALTFAAKAVSIAEGMKVAPSSKGGKKRQRQDSDASNRGEENGTLDVNGPNHGARSNELHTQSIGSTAQGNSMIAMTQLPHSTNQIFSVELPMQSAPFESNLASSTFGTNNVPIRKKMIADCTNVMQTLNLKSVPSCTVSISREGKVAWRDVISGTFCSAITVVPSVMAVGTADGCLYLYGTSPTSGWESGIAFRSHAPFVFGSPIVSLHLKDIEGKNNLEPQNSIPDVQIIVVTGDGNFGVYTIMPEPKLQYKGSLVPAIMHMRLASPKQTMQPKLVRMQITESKHLLAILSFQLVTPQQQNARGAQNRPTGTGGATSPFSGGSLQAFVYDRQMELWIRVSDSRFSLSEFYSSRPSLKAGTTAVLSQIDDSTRMEASAFSSRRGRDNITSSLYENGEERESSTSAVITRSHCEDRMACALALGSAFEFKHWLSLYVRQLTVEGNIAHLRFVVDMLIGSLLASSNTSAECDKKQAQYCWWLSSADSIFGLAKMDLVRDIVVPEMSKNRALQRLVNEIATEVKSLS